MNGLSMKYFVLKPKGKDIYAEASRRAMRMYASTIQGENPEFCKEIREWADKEWMDTLPDPEIPNGPGSPTRPEVG